MEKLTFEQIMEVLQSKIDDVSDFAFEDYDNDDLGLGQVKEVDQYGGEGDGSRWYSVKHFVDHDMYIRVDGYYSSYEGTDFYDGWGCCKEVRPQEKTIIIYK